tara:strand:- start:4866 stop:5054 length:189 start_codon:yes stop_codon:yes gene_type:complete
MEGIDGMSINNSIAVAYVATVILHNGQTVEQDLMATTRSKAKAQLKRDSQIRTIVSVNKPKI